MEHIIHENIVLKDISEEEFEQKSGRQRDASTLLALANRLGEQKGERAYQSALADVKQILARTKRQSRAFGLYDGEVYIGYIALADCETSTPEIQIELIENYRHRGIGYQALRLVIDEVFQRPDADFLIYRTHYENNASIALVEKCSGILVKSDSFIDQIIHRYHIYRSALNINI